MDAESEKVVIIGETRDGKKFRPSDWAERLATAVAKPGKGRHIKFNPRVHMAVRNGINCVLVEKSLQEEEPMLWEFLMNFAEFNNLKLGEE